ncbi:uncharacterized protein LOC126687693 [Mercurialis annua]|uniref:uncharacterized protein LOC126687693 n=1 Tax=Mercurialis annua TaxID=3986 RepID=UPI00216069ED|nr:uncharacterized protein LOC126687693 [Mercurialis annua]
MIGVWNIRGLNDPIKHAEVRKWIFDYKLSLFAIFETRVRDINIDKVWRSLSLRGWKMLNNIECNDLGGIWICYKVDVGVNYVFKSSQVMHCDVSCEGKKFMCSFIYGMNDADGRKQLWRDLFSISKENDSPLIVLGDFNAILSNADRCGGILANQKQCEDFQNFLTEANLNELKSKASFLNHGISDHSPVIITFNEPVRVNCKPFRFFNIWTEHKDFLETVRDSWYSPTDGFKMYQIVQKLTRLKRVLRNLNRDSFNNICMQVEMTKKELDSIQVQIQRDPLNNQLLEDERLKAAVMKKVLKWEENFFRQKSRVQWIELGDLNTRFFHNSMKQRQSSNRISQLNVDGEVVKDQGSITNRECVSEIDRKKMVDPVTNEEIKSAMFRIGSDKAPGADGYMSLFFKKCWSVIGGDICEAIRDFFMSGKLLKQINATIITLNPKVENALLLSDFRPISCCNVISNALPRLLKVE